MAYDYNKLRGRIKEKFETQAQFAKSMKMSEVALSQRLNNITKFTQDEITRACVLLNIDDSKIYQYFFARKIQKI